MLFKAKSILRLGAAAILGVAVFVQSAEPVPSIDSELGEPYLVYPIESGEFHATLVEYPFGSSPRRVADAIDSVAGTADSGSMETVAKNVPQGILLYLHGYDDYFFQTEMAEKADSAGLAFFAIDLHHYGRSIRPEDSHSDMLDIQEFYGELDSAVAMGKRITQEKFGEAAGDLPFSVMGHSQGGLIMSLYTNDRPDAGFAAVVLNSPFLDMNFGWFMKYIVMPIADFIGTIFPNANIGHLGNFNYANSVHRDARGEWVYNKSIKGYDTPDQHFGWLHAIRQGHKRIHAGLNVKYPMLVMYSNCSVDEKEWHDDYMRCDGVLDVDDITKYAPGLGPNVKTLVVQDGMHDLFLSRKDVRDNAYKAAFDFIGRNLKK